jgi:hypothetical protein
MMTVNVMDSANNAKNTIIPRTNFLSASENEEARLRYDDLVLCDSYIAEG